MKRTYLPLLLGAALLLSGCGSRDEARFDAFSEELRSRGDVVMTAEVRAEQEDNTCTFTLRYAESTDGGCIVEVVEPELIRGVKARMNADGTKLVYDSVAVDTGDDGGTGLSPMGALPLLVLVVRQGVRFGVAAAVAASAVLSLFAGPLLALRMCVAFAPVGLVLGWGIGRGWSGVRTFLAGLAASVASKLLAFLLLFFLMGIDPWQAQLDGLTQAFSTTLSMYEDMGLDAAAVAQSRGEIEAALTMIGKLAPLVVLIMGLSDTVVLFLLGGRILRRLGSAAPQLPPFGAWRLPVGFLYLFGFSLVGLYWGGTRELPAVYTGIGMMLLGALSMFILSQRKK